MDLRTDQFSVLEALLVHDSANRKFLPTLYPILDGWYSSNFGYRIDPFTGQQSMHEGIDFPAEAGTPIVATASGKVIFAEWHPAYGKMIEIDHGNGLVSRYAHTSSDVREGRRPRGARPADRHGRVDRPVHGAAPAFRGPPQRRSAEPGAVPAGLELELSRSAVRAASGRAAWPCECRGEAVLTPCFLARRPNVTRRGALAPDPASFR